MDEQTKQAASEQRWWGLDEKVRIASKSSEEVVFELAMDTLVSDHGGEAALPAFLDWLKREGTSQEFYGEALYGDPTLLEPMYDAFDAGWLAREAEGRDR